MIYLIPFPLQKMTNSLCYKRMYENVTCISFALRSVEVSSTSCCIQSPLKTAPRTEINSVTKQAYFLIWLCCYHWFSNPSQYWLLKKVIITDIYYMSLVSAQYNFRAFRLATSFSSDAKLGYQGPELIHKLNARTKLFYQSWQANTSHSYKWFMQQ